MNKDLEKWITLKECDSKSFEVCFVDLPDLTKLTDNKNLRIAITDLGFFPDKCYYELHTS